MNAPRRNECRHKRNIPHGEDGELRCLDCDRVYRPRSVIPKHGTYPGYTRHRRVRVRPGEGEWCWPVPMACGCRQAAKKWRKEYAKRPEVTATRQLRARASMAAMARMRRAYPAVYTQLYAEELARLGQHEQRQHMVTPLWDDIIRRLVKSATGKDEATLDGLVRAGRASVPERDVVYQVRRIRILLEDRYWERKEAPEL